MRWPCGLVVHVFTLRIARGTPKNELYRHLKNLHFPPANLQYISTHQISKFGTFAGFSILPEVTFYEFNI